MRIKHGRIGAALLAVASIMAAERATAKEWPGFSRGMGIGGWLTNYKRFNVLPEERRMKITPGDLEHFDSYITEADVARIGRWGFDHVRLGFDQIVVEEAPGRYRERTLRKIDEFIGWCGKSRLNVVLNLHKAVGNYCDISEKVQLLDDPGLQRRFIDLWLEMERRCRDCPNVAFELLNEVRDVDPEKWNALADRAIRAIRARNPDRWIVVGSVSWNSPSKLPLLKVWDDPRIVYTFHMYAPFEFTHQRGVLQAAPLYCNMAMEYPSTDVARYRLCRSLGWGTKDAYPDVKAIDREFLARQMQGAVDFVRKHPDKILWNGEFGTIRHAPPASRIAYMRDIVSFCRTHGIPYCVWNYLSTPNDGNRFSLVDDETREMLSSGLLDACLGRGGSAAAPIAESPVSGKTVLWKNGDAGIKSYRIPALCTAPNGDLVAACDARRNNGGDLNVFQPINITLRRSADGGKTWTKPVNSWTWRWDAKEKWSGSDPSFIVDEKTKKIFLFYNVWKWEDTKNWNNNVYRFYVQESSDNGKTWTKPRDISSDIAFPEWPFGKPRNKGGFIFLTSGTGIQTKDGTLLHTIVHVGDGNALFGSDDHGKTWKAFGKPVKPGDECKVVELNDGSWMINSRWRGGGRQIHVSKDRGMTWSSYYDKNLTDPQCNAQIIRLGKGVLLFTNCKSRGRDNLHLRASIDEGTTWSEGICIEKGGSAYSDMTRVGRDKIGIVYEGAGYQTINFVTVPVAAVKAQFE